MKKGIRALSTVIALLPFIGCSDLDRSPKIDDGIITSETASLRNSVAELTLEVGRVRRGDEVEILQYRSDGWVKIRTAGGTEGWVEASAVAKKSLVEEANALARQVEDIPTQAEGRLSGPTRLRLSPGRASDENVILTLPRHTRVQVLDRQRTVRESNELISKEYRSRGPRRRASAGEAGADQKVDDWYQARLPESSLVRCGWVYAPLVELQIPTRLVRLQEDHLIVGWFEVGQVEDSEVGPATHYLALGRKRFVTVPGTDFNRLELFWWNPERHRYDRSTRTLDGVFPVRPQRRNGAWEFQVRAYHRTTGELEEVRFRVDVSNPLQPHFAQLGRSPAHR